MTEFDTHSDREQVQTIVENWADAVADEDRPAILVNHASDLYMVDFPSELRGLADYDASWDFFYSKRVGKITFAPRDIAVTAGADVGLVTCTMHCDGTAAGSFDFRLTVGLEKRDGRWLIMHEHHSVPTTEKRFIDEG